jgi:transposase-like protein
LAVRLIFEEALESDASDALGHNYSCAGARVCYRNGYWRGRPKTAQGEITYSAPQVSARAESFRSRIRDIVRGRTNRGAGGACCGDVRGLFTRDIEAVFANDDGRI